MNRSRFNKLSIVMNMKRVLPSITAFVLTLAPVAAFAQGTGSGVNLSYFQTALQAIGNLITGAIPVVFALAILVFLWGIFKAFILGGSDPEKQAEGRQLMLYAVIGFFAMVAIWGLVQLLSRIVGIQGQAAPPPPAIPGFGDNN
jgi:hypothetical protein